MTKLHKKKANIFGKKVPVLLLMAIVAVGIASAALLPYFGQITGMATVNQSVTLDGESYDASELTGAWDGTFVAGKTFTENHTLENNADESVDLSIDTECSSEVDSGVQCDGITTGAYGVQEFSLFEDDSETDYSVNVTIGVDEVTYRVNLPEDYFSEHTPANADLQISPTHDGDEDNYHVKYSSDSHKEDGHEDTEDGTDFTEETNWAFYKPSVSKDTKRIGEENVLEREEIKSLEADENDAYFEVTVAREVDENQSFGVSASAGGEAPAYKTEDFSYANENVNSHQVPDFEEVSDLTLESGESFDFSLSNRFAINLVPDDYTITTTVDMAE